MPNELLAAGLDEMRRTIREQEPARPSTRLSTMPDNELSTTAQRRGLEAPKLVSQLRGDSGLDCDEVRWKRTGRAATKPPTDLRWKFSGI